jgi:hypothetical protein
LPEKKTSTRKPTVRRKKKAAVATPEDVAVRAYFLHLEDATAGELDNWLRAERELLAA